MTDGLTPRNPQPSRTNSDPNQGSTQNGEETARLPESSNTDDSESDGDSQSSTETRMEPTVTLNIKGDRFLRKVNGIMFKRKEGDM